tara:strand:+ start:699 stop:1007 length:309 start_codon:yes stop_codon:yes gene_type:complete
MKSSIHSWSDFVNFVSSTRPLIQNFLKDVRIGSTKMNKQFNHPLDDKQQVVKLILQAGANHRAVRRMVLHFVIRYLHSGRGPDAAKTKLIQQIVLRSFKGML